MTERDAIDLAAGNLAAVNEHRAAAHEYDLARQTLRDLIEGGQG